LQPVATSRKSNGLKNRRNKRKPLPCLATSCSLERMVRRSVAPASGRQPTTSTLTRRCASSQKDVGLTSATRTGGHPQLGKRMQHRRGARPVRAAERSAGRRGGQPGEHRGLPLERLLLAVEGIAVGQLAGVEVADMRPVGVLPDQRSQRQLDADAGVGLRSSSQTCPCD
jgi:hypothetical protein